MLPILPHIDHFPDILIVNKKTSMEVFPCSGRGIGEGREMGGMGIVSATDCLLLDHLGNHDS